MCKKLIYLISFVLVLGFASVASAATIAYWRFGDSDPAVANSALPDSDGRTVWRKAVNDDSGNGNHLTTWDFSWAGFNWRIGGPNVPATTVPLTGASNNWSMQNAGSYPASMTWSAQSTPSGTDIEVITPAAFTIEASFKQTGSFNYRTIVGRDGMNVATADAAKAPLYFSTRPNATVAIEFTDMAGNTWSAVSPTGAFVQNQWYNMVGVSDGSTLSLYLNNVLVAQSAITSTDPRLAVGNDNPAGSGDWDPGTWTVGRGLWNGGHVDRLLGYIDEVRISDTALKQSQFLFVELKAGNPQPANNSMITTPTVSLQWTRGAYAALHDVYFSDNFADVNTANTGTTTGVYKGRQVETQYPNGVPPTMPVTYGKTYYWRIDEVNAPPDPTVFKGQVWSFKVVPLTAYDPSPADTAKFVATNVVLSWKPGATVSYHLIYFGTNYDTVNNATTSQYTAYTTGTSWDPCGTSPLAFDKNYYWRIDEVDTVGTAYKGSVWGFKTLPDISVTDSNLIGWWMFEEGEGTTTLDRSGHSNHGTLINGPLWVTGKIGGGLQFDGSDDYVDTYYTTNLNTWTIAVWVRSPAAPASAGPTGPVHRENNYQINWNHTDAAFRGAASLYVGGTWYPASFGPLEANRWYHLAATYDGETLIAYKDGVLITSNTAPSGTPNSDSRSLKFGRHAANATYFSGTIDDVRVYNYALSLAKIKQIISPLEAWIPRPANGDTDVGQTPTLIWEPGKKAVKHDVYFSDYWDDVNEATTSSPPEIYIGKRIDPNYLSAGIFVGMLDLGRTYYWRVDEVNDPEHLARQCLELYGSQLPRP